jgi:glycosyltransferase involved in cell wall biosynthesis
MEKKKVSVIIPIYNASSTIERAIKSVLSQTYKLIEVIIVNDGSTDDTSQRLASFGSDIRIINQENQGRSAARNRGIKVANGEYVAFLDADDWWMPEKLEESIAILEQDQDTALVHSAYLVVHPSGWIDLVAIQQRGQENEKGCALFERLVNHNIIGSPSFVVLRASILKEIGEFKESLEGTEDWELWLRVSIRFKIAYLAKPLVYYQLHESEGIRRIMSRNVQSDWLNIIDDIFKRADVQARYAHCESPAKARVLLRLGMLDILNSENKAGQTKLQRAVKLDSTLLQFPCHEFHDRVVEFASLQWWNSLSLKEAIDFVNNVWGAFASSINKLGGRKNKGRLCETWFFRAQQYNDLRRIRVIAPYAIWYQPKLLFNFGFWSIWLRAFFSLSLVI